MEKSQLADRLLDFGVSIVLFSSKMNKSIAGRHVGLQLLRSATSSGANYEEACGAQSKADFIHKLHIVLKELRETMYWLRLIEKARLGTNKHYDSLISEARELGNIIGKSLVTAKRK